MKLYEHKTHPHKPRNVNVLHQSELAASGINQKIAIGMTKLFSSMPMFWAITLFMAMWLIGNITLLHFDPPPYPLLLVIINIPQLSLMIVVMVGQGLLSRKAELQAEEAYQTTLKSFHDIEQVMKHLDTQDLAILKILEKIEGGKHEQ